MYLSSVVSELSNYYVSRCVFLRIDTYRCHFDWWCQPGKSLSGSSRNEGVRL